MKTDREKAIDKFIADCERNVRQQEQDQRESTFAGIIMVLIIVIIIIGQS